MAAGSNRLLVLLFVSTALQLESSLRPLPSKPITIPRPIAYNRSQSLQSPGLRNCGHRIRNAKFLRVQRDRSSVRFRALVLGG